MPRLPHRASPSRRLTILFPLLLIGGCAAYTPPPAVSPIGKIAFYADDVMRKADLALYAVDALGEAGAVKPVDVVRFAEAIGKVGREGQRLAAALTILDNATLSAAERQGALSTAKEVIRVIQQLLEASIIPLPNEEAKRIVSTVILPITNTLIALLLVMPGGGL